MSIDVNVTNDLVIVTETTEDIVVNVSNAAGPQGPAGANGVGVPVGGTTGQVLKKFTNTNYDTYWAADASGLTSVGLSVPTGLTVSNSPLTTNGTIALGLASGYSIPTTASQATWNTAYNDSIVSAGVTGTTTKTLTLNQQDGGTVTASWSDIDTGLTSVGLSMPVAFSVANSPLTSNGTLAVSAAGTSAQYIRGDGQLANFPDNGGGGSSVNYYLNGSVTQGTFGGDTYYEMSKTPVLGGGTNFTRTNAQGNGYIASFITDAGDPSLLNIPGGNWNVEFYFQSSASGGSPQFYGELYKVSSANVFTLVASGSTNPEGITNGTTVDQYFTSIPVPQTSLLVTDRLAVRIYVIPAGRTITLHTENSNLCEVLTTFSTGLNALNGLTAQVQYFATGTSGTDFAISSVTDTHTFNLPTASATNRGALSSADWSTFSGKVGGTGATGQVAYWNGTSSQTGSNNLFWDAANARLGIGTNTPSVKLDVYDAINSNYAYFTAGTTIMRFGSSVGGLGILGTDSNHELDIRTNSSSRIRITTVGNVLVGTTTDGGQRLQVQGDAFIKGSGNTGSTTSFLLQNSDGTNIIRSRNDGFTFFNTNGLRISTHNIASYASDINGFQTAFTAQNTTQGGAAFVFQGNILTTTSGFNYFLQVQRNFAPTSGTSLHNDIAITSIINQTGGANGTTRGLYIAPSLTAAADWRSIEWSNNSGWGLYGVGTADNFIGGTLIVGQNSSFNSVNISRILSTSSASSVISNREIQSTVTTAFGFRSRLYTQTSAFAISDLSHFSAEAATVSGGATITNNYGFHATDELTTATNNYGFYGNIPNAANRWNLYMNGTADNYLRGKLLINTATVSTFALDVNGTARVSDTSATILTLNSTNGTGYSAIKIDASGVEKGLIGFGTYLTSDGGVAIRTAASTPFTIAIGGGVPTLTLATTGAATFSSNLTVGNRLTLNGVGTSEIYTSDASGLYLTAATNGGMYLASESRFIFRKATSPFTEYMRIESTGNVGIGTATPSYKMHVSNSGSVTSAIEATGAGADSVLRLISPSNYWLITNDGSSGNLTFNRGGSDLARFSNVGNLLVGTTTDAGQKFQVSGNGLFTGSGNTLIKVESTASFPLYQLTKGGGLSWNIENGRTSNTFGIYQSGGTGGGRTYLAIAEGGNVLINTVSDSGFRLDVSGTARIQGKFSISGNPEAQINLASSTAPTSPNNGDIWFDGTNLNIRVGGVTKTFVLL